jgi:hypothetical protein
VGNAITRRCQRFTCPNRIELDHFNPEDEKRRYCSPACERKDLKEIAQVEWNIHIAEHQAEFARWPYRRQARAT